MKDINRIVLVGRCVRNAELKYTNSGTAVCKFSLASNRRIKKGEAWEDKSVFIDIVLWGKSGEGINQYLTKGKMIAVEGELDLDTWESEGVKHYKHSIIADNVQLLGSKESNSQGNPNSSRSGKPSENLGLSDEINRVRKETLAAAFTDDIPF